MESENKELFIRNYHKQLKGQVYIFLFALVALGLICLLLLYRNSSLSDRVNNEIFIAVEDRVYSAIPKTLAKDDNDYKIFGEVVVYNMFSHDQFSFKERTDLVKDFMNENTFNYIMKSFEYKGQRVTDYYKKYDARLYYTIDSMNVITKNKFRELYVFGKNRAVFSLGDPLESTLNMRFVIKEIDRSRSNKFGLYIYDFNFIK
ncbi:MAG: hypothetical protein LBG17_08040 [Bacteroidales bacterium]|jgi:hypothetical protein|nr:hypothetical protein [Bacteroidales bacterium]